MSTLEGSPNPFGGFVVNPGALPVEAGRFRRRLAGKVLKSVLRLMK